MPIHYPSGYYGVSTGLPYNNSITRRLNIRDRVAFGQSTRFGGQWLEPKNLTNPYGGTIMDAVAACQQLTSEISQMGRILPDLGQVVILSPVGVATNLLTGVNGVGVSYIGGVTTNAAGASFVGIDGASIATGMRILYYGLTTGALNGVYTVDANLSLSRASDLTYWWQFVKPKVFLAQNGNNNIAKTFALVTDAFEYGNSFTVALGTSVQTPALAAFSTTGTTIGFAFSNYSIGLTTNQSLIFPPYQGGVGYGEYDFLAQNSSTEFIYLKNRAHRLAYRMFKVRENYTPFAYGAAGNPGSQYQTNIITATVGAGNTGTNIGFSVTNNLPSTSRYPSSQNRGF